MSAEKNNTESIVKVSDLYCSVCFLKKVVPNTTGR